MEVNQEYDVDYNVTGPADFYRFACDFAKLNKRSREEVLLIGLSTSGDICFSTLFKGGISSSMVDPAEVFKSLLLSNSSSFCIIHNHPSGSLNPSAEDYNVCSRLEECSKVLNVRMLDFMIISHDGYMSFRGEGHLR